MKQTEARRALVFEAGRRGGILRTPPFITKETLVKRAGAVQKEAKMLTNEMKTGLVPGGAGVWVRDCGR